MAFGKKKDDAPTPDADAEDAPEADAAIDEATPIDRGEADEGAPDNDAGAARRGEAAVAEAPAAANSDALLSMFQESKTETNDLSVLVDLAGDAEIDDILEELRTLRAALGITDAYEEADFAAAA